MDKQTWNAVNGDGQIVDVLFCDTVEQASGKLKHKYGSNSVFLRLKKGPLMDIELTKRIETWDANLHSLALISMNLNRIILKHYPGERWKYLLDDTVGSANLFIESMRRLHPDVEYIQPKSLEHFRKLMEV